jgi:1-acyl-sn-glycerol-3-phosphate acyltransferase
MSMRLIHSIFFYFVAVVSFFIGTFLAIVFTIFAKNKYGPFQFFARAWAKLLMFVSGSKVTISGLENVPANGGLIFASNHQGAFDILIHLAYLPRHIHFVAKAELFRIPIFGWYMKAAGYVPVEREAGASAHRAIGSVSEVLDKGECILIFPEGTRSKTGELLPFKRGSLLAAFQSGVPVIPVAISGSHKTMPKHTLLIKRVPIKLNIGKSISFDRFKGVKPTREDYERELSVLRNEILTLLK